MLHSMLSISIYMLSYICLLFFLYDFYQSPVPVNNAWRAINGTRPLSPCGHLLGWHSYISYLHSLTDICTLPLVFKIPFNISDVTFRLTVFITVICRNAAVYNFHKMNQFAPHAAIHSKVPTTPLSSAVLSLKNQSSLRDYDHQFGR